ncbi:MAG TPA: GntR family transcriptional regulator [Ktedonobacteraceae bacterium]|nr:GntR family transcriptional regulator [Ktedonobacteraceae bacterium]
MDSERTTLVFYLDSHSGVAPYLQLVQQVKQALRLGFLQTGDQLPTVREVVAHLTINPNTVFKAYRTLELEGLVASRPGLGTFVSRALVDPALENHNALRQRLVAWLQDASTAGLQDESIEALFATAFQEFKKKHEEESA